MGLQEASAMNAILVMVDRFSKMAHFIPTTEIISARKTAKLLLHHAWKLHSTFSDIISDRGPQFVSSGWKTLCQRIKIEQKLSTAYSPQTDSQTERINAQLEHYLRAYVSHAKNHWSRHLPAAEFSYSNACSSSTRQSPFPLVYGHLRCINIKPRSPDLSREPSVEEL